MSSPRLVVLYGAEAFQRLGHLINGMVNRPSDLSVIGRPMVDLMGVVNDLQSNQLADALQPTLRHFLLPDSDDPSFDQRIVIEAVTYGAKVFRKAWEHQTPQGLDCRDYRFGRFLGTDLVLERR